MADGVGGASKTMATRALLLFQCDFGTPVLQDRARILHSCTALGTRQQGTAAQPWGPGSRAWEGGSLLLITELVLPAWPRH